MIDSQKDLGPLTQFIIVRADLPVGMIAAQVAHAAGVGSVRHPPEVHVVVLAARNEDHLRSISQKLLELEVAQTLVEEVDLPYMSQAMSIGLELVRDRHFVNLALSSLPLLRESSLQSAALLEVVS